MFKMIFLVLFSLSNAIFLFTGCGTETSAFPSSAQIQNKSFTEEHIVAKISRTIIEAGQSVDYSLTNVDSVQKVEWRDSSSKLLSKNLNINRLFTSEGKYETVAVITDKAGKVTTQKVTVKVIRSNNPVEMIPNQTPVVKAKAEALDIMDEEYIHLIDDGSYDPDGTIVKYEWRDMDGILLSNSKTLNRMLHYDPQYDFNHNGTTRYVKTLTVTDDKGATASKSFEIIVHKKFIQNHPPVANAGIDMNITTGDLVVLNGNNSSDPDGDPLTYNWSVLSQPLDSVVVFSDEGTAQPTFSGDKSGIYILQLIVNDGTVDSAPDTIQIIQKSPILYGDINGTVRDAVTGLEIPNINLNIRTGENNHTGNIFITTTSDQNGHYLIKDLPVGVYTIEAVADGYITGYFTVEAIANQMNGNQNYALSPLLEEGETRIVLTWSENPEDLDSHLVGPDGTGGKFHVYYSNPADGNVTLDQDITTSYGPETITITQQHAGDYLYYVHNYTGGNMNALAKSNAKVEIYRNSSLIATYHVPEGEGLYWKVFIMNDTLITPINTIEENEPSL